MSETTNNYHECKALRNVDDITIQKIQGNWCWVFWGKKRNQAFGIGFCPYCGKPLYDEVKNS